MIRILLTCALSALVLAFSAHSAPLPPPPQALKPAQQLIQDVSLPPLGLFDPAAEKVKTPLLGKTDLRRYANADTGSTKARDAIRKAQLLLWASSPAKAPKALEREVLKLRKTLKQERSPLLQRVPVPANAKAEMALRTNLYSATRDLARVIRALENSLESLQDLSETRDQEPPRLQAQLDLMQGCIGLRLAYLEEHAGAMGQMRKELPAHGDKDRAWQLITRARVNDSASRKHEKVANKLLQRLIKEHPNTVWETLAQQAQTVQLGVSWQSVP